jgi:hypothetical protein
MQEFETDASRKADKAAAAQAKQASRGASSRKKDKNAAITGYAAQGNDASFNSSFSHASPTFGSAGKRATQALNQGQAFSQQSYLAKGQKSPQKAVPSRTQRRGLESSISFQ